MLATEITNICTMVLVFASDVLSDYKRLPITAAEYFKYLWPGTSNCNINSKHFINATRSESNGKLLAVLIAKNITDSLTANQR